MPILDALSPVKDLAASPAAGLRAELTWQRPDGDFAYQFRVYIRKDAVGDWAIDTEQVPSDHLSASYTFTASAKLDPTTRYWFKVSLLMTQHPALPPYFTTLHSNLSTLRVEAYTMIQPKGPAVEVELISAEAPPADAPTNLRLVSADLDAITIAWDPPAQCNGVLTAYTVDSDQYGAETFDQVTVPADQRTFTKPFLEIDTRYRFQVSAINASGEGPASSIITATTMASALSRFSAGNQKKIVPMCEVPPHKVLSIRGSIDRPKEDDFGPAEADVLGQLKRSAAKPKAVWCPVKPKPAPIETKEEPPSKRTNPDAVGRAALERRQSKEHMFVRRRTEDSKDMQKRIDAVKQATIDKSDITPVVSGGIANDAPDVHSELHRKKREYWAETLRRDRAERGSAARDLVGDEDALRLLRKGQILEDGTGETRGFADGVTAALGKFNVNDVVWQNELSRKLYFTEKEQTIVIYITTLEAVRKTRNDCSQMLKLFETMRLKVRVKDVHLEPRFADELCMRVERFKIDSVNGILPQLFINAVHIGGLDEAIQLVDTGEMKKITAEFERRADESCAHCGNTGFIICGWCQGSNKSRVHQFNEDPRKNALKCTLCNANGLVACPVC